MAAYPSLLQLSMVYLMQSDSQSIPMRELYYPFYDARSGITCNRSSPYTSLKLIEEIPHQVWYINTTAAQDTDDWDTYFDITCTLNNSWGFNRKDASTVSITINAAEEESTMNEISDLIVTFSEDDSKWFSIFLDLEDYQKNRIYPSCVDIIDPDLEPICLSSLIENGSISDINAESTGNRSKLFGGYPYAFGGTFDKDCALSMPITISMLNNPTANRMVVSVTDEECSSSYTYNGPVDYSSINFVGDNGLDVYLSMNSPYDFPIIIESLKFVYNPTNTTLSPTKDPTGEPTRSPVISKSPTVTGSTTSDLDTQSPTDTPSTAPTTSPSPNPSENPTYDPTYLLDPRTSTATTNLTAGAVSDISSGTNVDESFAPDTTYRIIIIVLICLFVVVVSSSYIDARCIRGRRNDFYSPSSLLFAVFQISDLISDIFFSLQIWLISTVEMEIKVSSVIFIVLPVTLSLIQLFMAVQRWRALGNDTLTAWLRNYAFWLYALSLVTGSAFSGTQVCRSDMFGLSQFAMPLNENQIVGFQSKKLWTTVMLEVKCFMKFRFTLCLCFDSSLMTQNIPQLALQIYFLTEYEGMVASHAVVYGSMLFSIISIISNVLTHCTQREIAKSTGWVSVQFRVTGNGANQRENRMRYKRIQNEFAAILEIDKSLIGIARPMVILNGLKMEMNIYVNHTQSIDMNIDKTLQRHIGSGVIAKIIKTAWNLQNAPIVSNLTVERIDSELRKEGAVHLSVCSSSAVRSQSVGGIAMQMSINSPVSSEINLSITPLEQFPKIPDPAIDSMTPQSPVIVFEAPASPISTAIGEGEEGVAAPEAMGTSVDYNDLVVEAAEFQTKV